MSEANGNIMLALCTGCGIGSSLDSDQLMETLVKENEGLICMQHPALCSEAGSPDPSKGN